jgi:hypothetical protein
MSNHIKQLNKDLEKFEKKEAKRILRQAEKNIKKINHIAHKNNYSSKILKETIREATKSSKDRYSSEMKFIKNLKYNGNDIIQIQINPSKSMSLTKVGQIASRLSRRLKKANIKGSIQSSIVYGISGWRSGKFGKIGNDVDIYDPDVLYNGDPKV